MTEIADKHFSQYVRYHKSFHAYRLLKHKRTNEAKTIRVFWGPTGTGKTRACYDQYRNIVTGKQVSQSRYDVVFPSHDSERKGLI